ncbi:alpha/beta hydrolase [Phormidesmis priestleyi ULC007]|uniref:Alpha/beta hydrolase n=1 Tax=Phormidesmis priestleyi ULC007 TaxID=1920490 RepID=A0A2T1D888_9CYAN|nr:alpha/beta hydrolase [Phormidesmis priestleyi]PSB16708.1 alpha/beta hydrolase [Phormidesmis priestleyi ULC007]PZO47591.1 MAG: alpha/beta hydrolase [Phormidesmis priestleyi]
MIQSHPCFLTPKTLKPNYPLFVFLPGMDGTGQLLRTQTEGLEAKFDVRCLAIPSDDLTSWDELAQQVVELVKGELASDDHPDQNQRSVYLCGESFGGCLAMKVAVLAPELFQRIILVNPASSFNRRPWISWGSQISRYLPEVAYQFSSVTFLPLLASFGRIAEDDRQALVQAVRSVPQKTSIWRMSLLHKFQVPRQQLRQLTQPVLIIASADDKLLPSLPEAYRLKRAFQNAYVVVLPESGHTCLLESGVNLYDLMKAHGFLDENLDTETISAAANGSVDRGLAAKKM